MKKLHNLFVLAISFIMFASLSVSSHPLTADQKIDSIKHLSSIYPDHVELIESIVRTYTDQLTTLDEDIQNFFPKNCRYVAPELLFLPKEEIIKLIKYSYLERTLMINLPPDKVNVKDKCHLHILAIFYNKSLSQMIQAVISVSST